MKLDIILEPLLRDERTRELRLPFETWRALVELSSRSGFTIESRLSGPDGRHAARCLRQGLRQIDAPAPQTRYSMGSMAPAETWPLKVFVDAENMRQLHAVIALLERGTGIIVSQRVPR